MTQVAMQKTVVARPEKRGKVQRLKFDLYDGFPAGILLSGWA